MSLSERFCGACGGDAAETIRRQEHELASKLAQAQEHRQRGEFDAAESLLREVVRGTNGRFQSYAEAAAQLLERFANEREERAAGAQAALDKALRHMASHAYGKALAELSAIPMPLRTGEIQNALREAEGKQAAIVSLGTQIREALGGSRKLEALPLLERLLALQPGHEKAHQLLLQLSQQAVGLARKEIHKRSFANARALLESIPIAARNADIESLLDEAQELEALEAHVRFSPVVDPALIALAERLMQLTPGDAARAASVNDMKRRLQRSAAEAKGDLPTWATPPKQTRLGIPASPLNQPACWEAAASDVAAVLGQHPGQFLVAFGLALQAIGHGAVNLSLTAAEKSTLFESLSLSLRKSRLASGWGIDLSASGLKAIRLAPELKDGRAVIEAAWYAPHARPLLHVDPAARKEIVTQTLRAFCERFSLAKAPARIAAGLPGDCVLGRFFEVPPAPARKLPDLVSFEARRQIPLPLDAVRWRYQVLHGSAGKPAAQHPRNILLLAARESHVADRLNLFKDCGIEIEGLTADSLALHNALTHRRGGDDSGGGQEMLVDIGAESVNFVVSGSDHVWFRNGNVGGNAFSQALVEQFQLTFSQAEQLKQAPHKASRLHRLESALSVPLSQLQSEIERSLAAYAQQYPERPIERIHLSGGGALTHGLLRRLSAG